ncbi:MAG: HesA/MoeB/ThiF family protein [Verrucomicrobia bacterium]|nr:HesA/MoeB/ThiF family protein [Verrucomicrobiota bacterium]
MPWEPESNSLTDTEREVYGWQLPVAGFGEAGQERLKRASVLISRCGGLGGMVAYELAAAGIGRLILAHAGRIKPSDLNRQLLMTEAGLGQSRIESAARRLRELNSRLVVVPVAENVSAANAERLVAEADLVVDCAPLFEERYALNRAAVRLGRPMVECAVYELEAHLTTFLPGQTGCLRCQYPEPSTAWTRRFPVFGAVSGMAGSLAALEAIKVLAGFGRPLAGRLLTFDLREPSFRCYTLRRDPQCADCAGWPPASRTAADAAMRPERAGA